ncbi:MAG: AI-2E family transporter [Cryomorphaceae bacterium]
MTSSTGKLLLYTALIILSLYFFVSGISVAASVLKPIAIAALLAMVLLPLSRKFEKWGVGRAITSLLSVLVSIVAVVVFFGVFAIQVHNVSEDWPEIRKNLEPGIERAQDYISEKTGLSTEEQVAYLQRKIPFAEAGDGDSGKSEGTQTEKSKEEQASESSSDEVDARTVGRVGTAMAGIFGFFGSFLLVFIYIFFFLMYRSKIKNSILLFLSEKKRAEGYKVLAASVKLSEDYLIGRLILISILAVVYSIGLSAFGVKNAIFISIFAAVLTLIPYVGNIIGFVLAFGMALFSGGGLWVFIGVAITFSVAQFVESYILEPFVVGDKVNLNPLITILVVVLGGAVWGIVGMVISIPLFGILKIACDHIPALSPIGYALGNEGMGNDEPNAIERFIGKLRDKFKK